MKLSIILVSYNRPELLKDTIQYCLAQNLQAYEIIIVDASQTELRQEACFLNHHKNIIKYITWDEIGNISRQRNAGIKEATGDVILFLDDDVKFNVDLTEKALNRLEQLNADALSGIIESSHRAVSKEVYVFKKDPMLYLGQPSFHQNDFLVQTYLISAACFIVKRDALIAIGGFDEQLKGVFDDSDVGIRLTNAGFLVYHDNKFSVYHFAAQSSGSRSPKLGPVWKYANICYIQIKHFYKNNEILFYKKSISFFLRPSKRYLKPLALIKDLRDFRKGYKAALIRKKEGPKYISQ